MACTQPKPDVPTVTAVPTVESDTDSYISDVLASTECLTSVEAQQVADNFKQLISNYTSIFANETLAADFQDYSDSVSTLIDNGCNNAPQPLGVATFASRADFEKDQSSQPSIPFEQLNIWNNCNNVFIRWRTALTPENVTGIIVLEVKPNLTSAKQTWLIKTVFSEFNSGAWLVDLGAFDPKNCQTSK
ncbi:Hypothetical protein R9X50_00416200 [Acrodontium crateriforme]|uniref:NTF2-like domain-containing protein n=1 Tax=Acrodontium crateriforme TaxID=150365 RepID=A0AAQ3M4X5_9PEZI|nr:Hypothetical protein R9X50_00416200 [Acrodontium crateriforme]